MEYALSNDSISIKVSTAGGSFTSIEAGGREYLWQGDPAVWSGQAPICFPICGGLRDNNAITFAGFLYRKGIFGKFITTTYKTAWIIQYHSFSP